MGSVRSFVAPSSSVSTLFSVCGALNSSCLCTGRGWGKLRASEAKRSGLALEQGSGLLFHKLISSQGCTAASQKSRQLITSLQGRRCSVPVCWVGTSTPCSPWPSRKDLPKIPGSRNTSPSRAPFVPASHPLPALPSHSGCSCLFSLSIRASFPPSIPAWFLVPAVLQQAGSCSLGSGAAGLAEPEEDPRALGEREAVPGT